MTYRTVRRHDTRPLQMTGPARSARQMAYGCLLAIRDDELSKRNSDRSARFLKEEILECLTNFARERTKMM